MNTYTQTGDAISLIAPSGGVVSGQGFVVGSIFGVANTTEIAGAPVEAHLVGVFNLPAKSGDTFAVGDKAYWVVADKVVTSTASGNKLIGAVTQAVAGGFVGVRLNGVALA
jgi:predicted RecA/RadA family phage recombinase